MDNTKHDPAVLRKRVLSWCTKLAALGDEPTFEDVDWLFEYAPGVDKTVLRLAFDEWRKNKNG